jgi:hypothetical protein
VVDIGRGGVSTISVLLIFATSALYAEGPDRPVATRVIDYLGFTAPERERLQRGEITTRAFGELSDKELAVAMAVLVPAPLARLVQDVRSAKALELDREIQAHGSLDDADADDAALRRLLLDASEREEIRTLFEAKPGEKINLAASEWRRFEDLRGRFGSKPCENDVACREAVLSLLRDVLRDRLAAYRARGIAGIEGYAREGGGRSDPAAELRGAMDAARFLAREYPAIFEAFKGYPGGDQSGMENHLLWLKQRVQDRPTFILSHRVLCVREEVAFAAERQFYVGHSYNSLQILYGLIPVGEQTLVVYLNRTSTDQVAGFMSGTRHDVGRRVMEKAIRRHFEELLAGLQLRGAG